jgi:hypothetical protein
MADIPQIGDFPLCQSAPYDEKFRYGPCAALGVDRQEWHLDKGLLRAMAVLHFLEERAWPGEALVVLGASLVRARFAPVGTIRQQIIGSHFQHDLPAARRLSLRTLWSVHGREQAPLLPLKERRRKGTSARTAASSMSARSRLWARW